MNIGIIYAITALVCLFQMQLVLNRTITTKYTETIDYSFCRVLRFFSAFCIVDALWGLASTKLFIKPTGFTIISYGFHSFAAASAYIGFGYLIRYINSSDREIKILNIIRNVLITIQVIALVSNFWSQEGFRVDVNGDYHMGTLRIVFYTLQFMYYIILLLFLTGKCIKAQYVNRRNLTAFLYAIIALMFGVGQYIFYDMPMYSLGFLLGAFIIYAFEVNATKEEYMEDRLSSLDKKQSSIIYGLAGNFLAIYYVDVETGNFEIYRKSKTGTGLIKEERNSQNYFDEILIRGDKLIIEEEKARFRTEFDKEKIINNVNKNGTYSVTIQLMHEKKEKYFNYKFVKPILKEQENKLIVGVYDVDAEVRAELRKREELRKAVERENRLHEEANKDALTGAYNRRAYESDIRAIERRNGAAVYTYISMDLNGLKYVNDNLGHEAGDELIKGLADCLNGAFGKIGKVYRFGGDEFVIILYEDGNKVEKAIEEFEVLRNEWRGVNKNEMFVAYGYVKKSEAKGLTIHDIAAVADKRMFESKEKFYETSGINRRENSINVNSIVK